MTALTVGSAGTAMTGCLAAIVLLIDVSASVGPAHYATQRDGTAAAFDHPQMIRIVEASQGIAVTVAEFSVIATTRIGWTMLTDRTSSHRFANALRALQRSSSGMVTAFGQAIEHGHGMLRDVPCHPGRRVIDLSTDGHGMDGDVRPSMARDAAAADGIEVNAVAFPRERQEFRVWPVMMGKKEVTHGPTERASDP